VHPVLAPDLPCTQGPIGLIELRCPERSIVKPIPPPPIGGDDSYGAVCAHCSHLAPYASTARQHAGRFVYARDAWATFAMAQWTGIGRDDKGAHVAHALCDVPGRAGAQLHLRS
jgi:hypothetical protein